MTAGLLAAIGLVAVPTAGIAADNVAIAVGDVTLSPGDKQIVVGDTVFVSGSWNASDANPQPGDTFTITLPAEFAFPAPISFPLPGDGVTWGSCLTDPDTGTATCTLSDALADYDLIEGKWGFDVKAIKGTPATEVNFQLNGRTVAVPLPAEGGIDDGVKLPGKMTKDGVMNSNNWSMTWTVNLPGANMAGQETLTLRDTLGAGHVLCDPIGLKVHTVRGTDVRDVTAIASVDGLPGDTDFDLVLTAPADGFNPNVTYRVTYQTCTPDGQIDPAGTEYANSALVEAWGSAGVGVSTVKSNPWVTSLQKTGRVIEGREPDGTYSGRVSWSVVIPGDELVGKSDFTLSEKLGAGHAVGPNVVSGLRIFEQYGPSDEALTSIDPATLPRVALRSDPQDFAVKFEVPAGSSFAFKPSDYRYIVTYSTYITQPDLPQGGTAYVNSVSIGGDPVTSSAAVPPRNAGKSGGLNAKVQMVDGVEYMPQTTLTWDVVIPGEKVHGLTELALTDTLSDSQVVCAAGEPTGGPASRLGLNVQAKDQISGEVLPSIALTGRTAASIDGQAITFTIRPEGGFSREYQYTLRYTTCTATGGMDVAGTQYGNSISGSGINFTRNVSQNNRAFGTGTGVTRGSVSISKSLADNKAAAFVPAGAAFTVRVQEVDPSGTAQGDPYDLSVPLNGDPAKGLNARGTGWTARLSEPTFPAIRGVTWGKPSFKTAPGVTPSADGTTAVAALTPGSNVSVSVENTALLGSVQVTKKLTGPDAARDLVDEQQRYRITAKVDTSTLGAGFPAQPDRTFDLAADETATLNDLPIGAVVTFSEAKPADDDVLTWSQPVISPQSLTISGDNASQPAAVTVTNHVTRTVGTFSIVKSVTGAQQANPAVPEDVTVTATWHQDGVDHEKVLTVPTDGTPVALGEQLLIGTKVTLIETPLVDGSSIAWGAPVWSGTGVVIDGSSAVVSIGRDTKARVSLENHAATSVAGISLIKGIAGAAAGEVADTTEFPITATWMDADGKKQSKELTINAVEPTSLGVQLPAGTVVTIVEGKRPAFDTVIWGSITISGDAVTDSGEGSAEILVSNQQDDVTLVTVVNEATWAPGTFTLSKAVEGVLLDNADVPETVMVTASWLEDGELVSVDVELPTDGTAVDFGRDLPHDTRVALSEIPLADTDAFTWNAPVWSGDGIVAHEDGTATLTISAAVDAEVGLTNSVTALLGSLSVTKALTGDGAALAENAAFPVTATWTDLVGEKQKVELTVRAGQSAVIDDLPLGTVVTLVEHEAKVPANARWHGATWSSDDEAVEVGTADGDAVTVVVTGESGIAAAVDLSNEYEKLPDLAVTGGALLPAGIIVLAALLIGLGVLLVARRRRA
ncbi:hypothetical protein CW368_07240 [Actinomycetales bacterium SN12]|nr:hypothetical protein CW368_07240 [Actinomycetales bacterium SN12]